MVTTGAKYFFGVAALALGAMLVYGWASEGGLLGVLSLGIRGGIGEHVGFTILGSVAVAAAGLGVVSVAFRDADPDAVQAVAAADQVPDATAPAGLSPWPIAGAFAATVTILGLVLGSLLFVIGLVLIGVVMIEWLVQAWADRATGDPATNRQIRNRFMYPVEIPLIGAVAIGVVVVAFSRVLLAVSANAAVAVAGAVAVAVLGVAVLVASRPRLSTNVIVGMLVVLALAVIAGGITAATVGEREFEPHTEEHTDEAGLGAPTMPLGRLNR